MIKISRLIALFNFGLLTFVIFAFWLAQMAAANTNRALSGAEIGAAIAGKTGYVKGEMAEYHGSDGLAVIQDKSNGQTRTSFGRWYVKADQLCYKYVDRPKETYCWRVFQMADGAIMFWGVEDQLIMELRFQKGDTAKLLRKVTPEARQKALALR